LRDPAGAQNHVLEDLAKKYANTRYGVEHSADKVTGVEDYREKFPVLDYGALRGYLDDVKRGRFDVILHEPPRVWVMTRGSTGASKVLPATETHLKQILACGARALLNHIVRSGDAELATGKILNLSLPSHVADVGADGSAGYGYSSGTYSRIFPSLGGASLVPAQEEIDALGPGITKRDWEKRFEAIYSRAASEGISSVIGVAPVILSFAQYMKRTHGRKPKDTWKTRAIFATSVRKIQSRYAPLFRKYFGDAPTVEMYSATEGVFAQQLDHLPYVTPNFDAYLFEVEASRGTKMLHELTRGEWGRLIVSTCMFPRYDIGDMVEAMGKNYFRVFGRAKFLPILEHRLYRLLFGWFL